MSEMLGEGVGQRQSNPPKKVKKKFEVRRGLVKVYPTPPGWTVTWVSLDGRKRKWFSTETKAREFAGTTAEQLLNGVTKTITTEEMASLQRARELLAPHGVSIELAASEWAQ